MASEKINIRRYLYILSVYSILHALPSLAHAPFNFLPPSLPIAVKSPYVNAWFSEGGPDPDNVGRAWEAMWNYQGTPAWQIAVRVDGVAYSIAGSDEGGLSRGGNLSSTSFTPTQTIFSYLPSLGGASPGVQVNLTFLSPVNPMDLLRQSLPISYAAVTVESYDGKSHDVQVYADITAQWLSSSVNPGPTATWNSSAHSGSEIHQIQLEGQFPLTDIGGFAQGGTLYYAMVPIENETWNAGVGSIQARAAFNESGILSNTVNGTFRGISDSWPVFAFAADLGNISTTTPPAPVVFVVGLITDPAIQYVALNTASSTLRSSYFWTNFSTALDVVSFAINDYPNALSSANALDEQLVNAAQGLRGGSYPGLVALALRQAMSSLEITVGKDGSGNVISSDVMAFQKSFDTSSITDVNVMYATFPMLLYLNPELPWDFNYAAQILGTNYPNATGWVVPHDMGVEVSASMLIMVLGHAQTANDSSLVFKYYPLLSKWANYLVDDKQALFPGTQTGSHPTASSQANQTNVALNGIIGIAAMARISTIMGNSTDAQFFQNFTSSFLEQWIKFSMPLDNSTVYASYGQTSSVALLPALFADQLLGLNLVPQSVYQAQLSVISSIPRSDYGVALDSNNGTFSSLDATMMLAAALNDTSPETATTLIDKIFNYVNSSENSKTLFSEYNTLSAVATSGINSAEVAAIFSLLALSLPKNITGQTGESNPPPPGPPTPSHRSSSIGAIVGGVVGGVVVFAIGGFLICKIVCRRRDRQPHMFQFATGSAAETIYVARGPGGSVITPFAVPTSASPYFPPTKGSKAGGNSQANASSEAGTSCISSPVNETTQLRNEVERLRQVISSRSRPPSYYTSYHTAEEIPELENSTPID